MNKNKHTILYTIFLSIILSFFIFLSKADFSDSFENKLIVVAILQVFFFINYLGIRLFQNTSFMKKSEKIYFLKHLVWKVWLKGTLILSLSALIAINFSITFLWLLLISIFLNGLMITFFVTEELKKSLNKDVQFFAYFLKILLIFTFLFMTLQFSVLSVSLFLISIVIKILFNILTLKMNFI
jgi:hypothetical protein